MAQQNYDGSESITGNQQVSQKPLDENSSQAPGSGYKQSESTQVGGEQQDREMPEQDRDFGNSDLESENSEMDTEFDDEDEDELA